jgi:hypothetical protein
MRAILLFCLFPLVVSTIGCGSGADTVVVEAPQMSEAERQKQMEDYDKEMNAGN